jgi:phospholipid/cholesterol/gamma-HCH transport system permease protein
MRNEAAQFSVVRTGNSTLLIRASQKWHLDRSMPSANSVLREIEAGGVRRVAFDTSGLTSWDSSLITFLIAVADLCRASRVELDSSALPPGAKRLLALTEAVPEREGAHTEERRRGLLARTGVATIAYAESVKEFVKFVGEVVIAFIRALAAGRAFAESICSRLFGPVALTRCRSSR